MIMFPLTPTSPLPIPLPSHLREPLGPLFRELNPPSAMKQLLVDQPRNDAAHRMVGELVRHPSVAGAPALQAALWLYVDDLDAAHEPAQSLATPTASLLHAVVHRREGDFNNALYWYRKAGNHGALGAIDLTGGGAGSGTEVAAYNPVRFVERVQTAQANNDLTNPALVSIQHKEWRAIFDHCVMELDRAAVA